MEVIKSYHAGEMIFQEGDACDALFIIKVGRVEIFKHKAEREIAINVQEAGEVLGLLTFFNSGRRLASARALSYVEGLLIQRSPGQGPDSVSTLPQWVQIVLREFTLRLGQMNEKFITSTIEMDEIKQKIIDPVFISIQVAKSVGELATMRVAQTPLPPAAWSYDELKSSLNRFLEYEESTIDDVLRSFDASDLLRIEKVERKETVQTEAAKRLSWYPEYFRQEILKNTKLLKLPIPENQRQVLLALSRYVEKTVGRLNEPFQIEMPLLASHLESITGTRFLVAAIELGVELGLLELKESPNQILVKFVPEQLQRALIVADVVRRLRTAPHFE